LQPINENDKKRVVLALALLGALVGVCAALLATGRLQHLISSLSEAFQGKEALRDYVQGWGSWAPAAFIFVQALQVVIAPIPGEFTGAVGGFIFGAVPNVTYSTIGLTVGSILAFVSAKMIGLPFVKLVVNPKVMDKFHFLTERRGTALALILFVIPGFPKDILSYLLGLSPMSFIPFLFVCGVGRLPGTVMLSYGGSALYEENWPLLVALSVAAAVMASLTYLCRDRINVWLRESGGTGQRIKGDEFSESSRT
jgi:uncharacterized membrane protein YdjX (TVP38/TMEM64 family)